MSYTKRGLCLRNLEVIKPASGGPTCVVLSGKCPFFCPEETVHGYQPCIYERVIPDYNACERGQQLFCKHAEVPTLRVSRFERNPYRPYFSCRRKEKCQYELPIIDEEKAPTYEPRPKLQRQFGRTAGCRY